MDGKQKGFTLIEILVVVTIIGVLAGLVVVLIPRGQFEAKKTECMSNVRDLVGLLEGTGKLQYPEYSGCNLILYFVKKGDIEGEDYISNLFCPGDETTSFKKVGGVDAYKDLELSKNGQYDHLTSYAGRDQTRPQCTAKKGSTKSLVLICDDNEEHHDQRGFVVGLTGGGVKFKDKVDDWGLDKDATVEVGEGSRAEELDCLRRD